MGQAFQRGSAHSLAPLCHSHRQLGTGAPQALPGTLSPRTAHFPAGFCSRERFHGPGAAHRPAGLHQNAHLCWQRGMEQGLENIGPCLSEGTETQYSSAQTELGCGPHYPVLKSSLAMISPPCPETPGPRGPHRALHFLLVALLQGQSELTSPGPSVPCKGPGGHTVPEPRGKPQGISQKTDTKITFSHSLLIWREVCVRLAVITHSLWK